MDELIELFGDIADAIRNKKETTDGLVAETFPDEINSIETVEGEEIIIDPSTELQEISPSEGKNAITKATVNAVTNEIDGNIIPENIKKDVSILGVLGVLEEGSASGGDVLLFTSVEEMNAKQDVEAGTLAVVYGTAYKPVEQTTEFQVVKFPETVVLPTAQTSTMSGNFYDADNNRVVYLTMTATYCRIRDYMGGGYVAQYSSEDGITYTRTTSTETYDFGVPSKSTGTWRDQYGLFMHIETPCFEGLFEYDATASAFVAAKNQLNVTAGDLLTNKTAYGSTGIVVGDGTVYENLDAGEVETRILGKTDEVVYEDYCSVVSQGSLKSFDMIDFLDLKSTGAILSHETNRKKIVEIYNTNVDSIYVAGGTTYFMVSQDGKTVAYVDKNANSLKILDAVTAELINEYAINKFTYGTLVFNGARYITYLPTSGKVHIYDLVNRENIDTGITSVATGTSQSYLTSAAINDSQFLIYFTNGTSYYFYNFVEKKLVKTQSKVANAYCTAFIRIYGTNITYLLLVGSSSSTRNTYKYDGSTLTNLASGGWSVGPAASGWGFEDSSYVYFPLSAGGSYKNQYYRISKTSSTAAQVTATVSTSLNTINPSSLIPLTANKGLIIGTDSNSKCYMALVSFGVTSSVPYITEISRVPFNNVKYGLLGDKTSNTVSYYEFGATKNLYYDGEALYQYEFEVGTDRLMAIDIKEDNSGKYMYYTTNLSLYAPIVVFDKDTSDTIKMKEETEEPEEPETPDIPVTPTEGIKHFASMEEMNADETAAIGDLAVVYGTQMQKLTRTDAFSSLLFPPTVVLKEAVTDYLYIYGSCYGTPYADIQGMLDSSMAEMYIYTESGSYRIEYASTDGITYTRTDSEDDAISFGGAVQMDWMDWNDVFSEFMQMGGYVFEGLFEYGDYVNTNVYEGYEFTTEANGNTIKTTMNVEKLKALIPTVMKTPPAVLSGQKLNQNASWVIKQINDTTFELYASCTFNDYQLYYTYSREGFYRKSDNKWYLCLGAYVHRSDYVMVDTLAKLQEKDTNHIMIKWTVDTATGTVTATQIMSSEFTTATLNTYTKYIRTTAESGTLICSAIEIDSENEVSIGTIPFGTPSISGTSGILYPEEVVMQKYLVAKSQLDATADYVYDKNFIGKNGAEAGTLGATENVTAEGLQLKVTLWNLWSEIQTDAVSLKYAFREYAGEYMPKLVTPNLENTNSMFYDAAALKEISLFDTSKVTDASYMFRGCQALEVLPAFDFGNCSNFENMFANCYALKNIPDLDTSKANNFWYMFQNCTGLEAVPNIDTSKGTKLKGMFRNCKALTTIPVLDTTSATDVDYLIEGCDNLLSEGLNNAMQICVNIGSKYSATKTLKNLGMSSAQATTATTLSNWSTLSSLGWTTGY